MACAGAHVLNLPTESRLPDVPVYVAERQVEYWTNVGIQLAAQSLGFAVHCYPITQTLENVLGVDAIFDMDFVKLFGLQHKVLYSDGGDHWRLRGAQHKTLRDRDWTYYCCSDMTSMSQAPSALHWARFYDPRDIRAKARRLETSTPPMYKRWGAFFGQVQGCAEGVRLRARSDLEERLGDNRESLSIVDTVVLLGWNVGADGTRIPGPAVVFDQTLRNVDDSEALQ